MIVDLSMLQNRDAKWAVHCPTKESAEAFLSAMRRQYPSHTEAWLDTTRWSVYKDDTVYCPDINGLNGDNRLTFADLGFFMVPQNGFTVITFDSLCGPLEDLPEFDSSDIETLLSMLV